MIHGPHSAASAARSLSRAAAAIRAGNAREELRHADSARRIAPDAGDGVELCGRLWCSIGEHETAFSLLSKVAGDRSGPDTEAALIESLVGLCRYAEALDRLGSALKRFAVSD